VTIKRRLVLVKNKILCISCFERQAKWFVNNMPLCEECVRGDRS
jgi:hypothetical protein